MSSILENPAYAGTIVTPDLPDALRHYNPGLAAWKKKLIIAWRVELTDGTSDLALGELDGLTITHAQRLHLRDDLHNALDPRLCVAGGKLWLLYAWENRDGGEGYNVQQHVREITRKGRTWSIGEAFVPRLFGNGEKLVKNWIPFEYDGDLTVMNGPAFGGSAFVFVPGIMEQPVPVECPFGSFSGRTQALRVGDELVALVGGHRPHISGQTHYYFAAMTWDAATLQPLRLSHRPLAWGGENDVVIPTPRCDNYKPLCLFPSGLIVSSSDGLPVFIAACGVNDSFMVLLRFTFDDLDLVPIAEVNDPSRSLALNARLRRDEVRVRVISKHPIGEGYDIHHPGDVFITTRPRFAAILPFVEEVAA